MSEVGTTVSPARIHQFTLGGRRALRDVVETFAFFHEPRRNAGHGVGTPDPVDRRGQEGTDVELEATFAPRPNTASRCNGAHGYRQETGPGIDCRQRWVGGRYERLSHHTVNDSHWEIGLQKFPSHVARENELLYVKNI
jgi:hypothetical protein